MKLSAPVVATLRALGRRGSMLFGQIAGAGSLLYGIAQVNHAAAWIVGGVLAIAVLELQPDEDERPGGKS